MDPAQPAKAPVLEELSDHELLEALRRRFLQLRQQDDRVQSEAQPSGWTITPEPFFRPPSWKHKVPFAVRKQVEHEREEERQCNSEDEELSHEEGEWFEECWREITTAMKMAEKSLQAAKSGTEMGKLSSVERKMCERTLEI